MNKLIIDLSDTLSLNVTEVSAELRLFNDDGAFAIVATRLACASEITDMLLGATQYGVYPTSEFEGIQCSEPIWLCKGGNILTVYSGYLMVSNENMTVRVSLR